MKKSLLISFILRESTVAPRKALIVAFVSGASNALILAMINAASQHAEDNEVRPLYALAFVASFIFYNISERWLLVEAASQMEMIIHKVRTRIVKALSGCELLDVESLGRAVIYQGVAQHTQTLSQSASTLAISLQMIVMTIFTTIYIGYLSLTSVFVLGIFLGISIFIYFEKFGDMDYDAYETLKVENEFYAVVSDMVDGFKETKINSHKARTIINRAQNHSQVASDGRSDVQKRYAAHFVYSNSIFYLLLAVMVFIVPMVSPAYASAVQMSTTAVLFIVGPISGLVGSVPMFKAAEAGIRSINELEEKLSQYHLKNKEIVIDPDQLERPEDRDKFINFKTIELKDVVFKFEANPIDDASPFGVGPINLTINKNETLFITGGNGSGKSTLMRVLTALYPPASGNILIDGKKLRPKDYQSYRELFATVFSDFHLSRYLDGVRTFDDELAESLIEKFELPEKVYITDNAFSDVDLSTGQRKRIALVAAILEKKKVLILDEWAADQDPLFRRKFYREILPMLKNMGITIIAITHDSRFFDASDNQLHMEEGQAVNFDPDAFHD